MNALVDGSADGAFRRTAASSAAYITVVLAAWNAVLRPSVDIPITPYYLLSPFIIASLAISSRWFRGWLKWFFVVAAYGLVVGTVNGVPWPLQLAQLLKYAQLIAFFGVLRWLLDADPLAPRRLRRLTYLLAFMVFAIAVLQELTGFEFPTVVNEESSIWLNTFFFTPNDVALFLGGVLCIALCSNGSLTFKALLLLLISALNLRNDAKAVILATLLMLSMLALIKVCNLAKARPIVGVLTFVVLVPLAVIMLSDTVVEAGDSEFNFLQLFLDPIQHISDLEPYDLGGSIFDRTDALIHSLTALKAMCWLGLGPAGSVHTLSLPNFELLTAKSLHNALAEFLVEFGPVAIAIGAQTLRPFFRALGSRKVSRKDYGYLLLVAAAPMLSVSQSSGYISNYAFWLTAFMIWHPRVPVPERNPAAAGKRRKAQVQRKSKSKSLPQGMVTVPND